MAGTAWLYESVLRPILRRSTLPCPACTTEGGPTKDFRDCDCDEGRIARKEWRRTDPDTEEG